jgi:hypothetical protein
MPTFNPQTWQQMNILIKNQMLEFMKQLSNWASWIQTATGLASILSGSSSIDSTMTKRVTTQLSTTGNVSVDCTGANSVTVTATMTSGALTLTLNNLSPGVEFFVQILNSTGATQNIKVLAGSPLNVSAVAVYFNTQLATGTAIEFVTTALALLTGHRFAVSGGAFSDRIIMTGVLS